MTSEQMSIRRGAYNPRKNMDIKARRKEVTHRPNIARCITRVIFRDPNAFKWVSITDIFFSAHLAFAEALNRSSAISFRTVVNASKSLRKESANLADGSAPGELLT
jgi:hypothetical protein